MSDNVITVKATGNATSRDCYQAIVEIIKEYALKNPGFDQKRRYREWLKKYGVKGA